MQSGFLAASILLWTHGLYAMRLAAATLVSERFGADERGPTRPGASGDIVNVEDDGTPFIVAVDELRLETVLALNFGVGTDFRIPVGAAGVGLRLELSNHVAHSPVGLRIRELSPFGGLTSEDTVRFGRVHHLRASAGLVVQIGR